MASVEIDLQLNDEQKAMRDMVRKFGAEVIRPVGVELDKLSDPADVIAEDSKLWDVFRQYRELGLHKTGFPKALGGMAEDMDPLMSFVITEEIAYADVGLAISLGVAGMPFGFAQMSPEPKLRALAQDYVNDASCSMIGCWGAIEPDHGSDWMLSRDDPSITPGLKGVLKGDEYILNGQKAAWVSNGTVATHSLLYIGLDPSKGMSGAGVAICPLDLPGISKGKPLDKIGQRPLNQGEIFFEDARLPKEYMLVTPEMMGGQSLFGGGAGGSRGTPMASMAVMFGGLARAALDEGVNYAKERIQGGVPIYEHKNIKLKLFEMFMKTESVRAFAHMLFTSNASMAHVMAGKWLSTEAAFHVASEAIQVHGGNGLSREYAIEKIFRDARAGMIEDGVNETLALGVADLI